MVSTSPLPREPLRPRWTWHATRVRITVVCITLFAACAWVAPEAEAQAPDAATRAQQQYELDIAICNTAGFPAPQREACVREAGLRLDRARSAPPPPTPAASVDGRATVVSDPGSTSALRGSAVQTSPDGRATVVVPVR